MAALTDRQERNAGLPGTAGKAFAFPQGSGFAYIIGETGNVRGLRQGSWGSGRVGGHDRV